MTIDENHSSTTRQQASPSDAINALNVRFLGFEGDPINGLDVRLMLNNEPSLLTTNSLGCLPTIQAQEGSPLEIAVKRFDGSFKVVDQCAVPAGDTYWTLISPRMVFDATTEAHTGEPGTVTQHIPQSEQNDRGDLGKDTSKKPKEESHTPSNTSGPSKNAPTGKSSQPRDKATRPPGHIAHKPSTPINAQPKQEGRDTEGHPWVVRYKKLRDWWDSWHFSSFNLWGWEDSPSGPSSPHTTVAYEASMQDKVAALLEFAEAQTEFNYKGEHTADIVSSMANGKFKHKAGEKLKTKPLGLCYTYVKVALSRTGITDGILALDMSYEIQLSASESGPALLAKGFTDVTNEIPDPRWAAPGDIIVYEWTPDAWANRKKKYGKNCPNHGHIEIRSYDGYISDFFPMAEDPWKGHISKPSHSKWKDYKCVGIYRKYYDPMPILRTKAFLHCLRELETEEERNEDRRYYLCNMPLPNGSRYADKLDTHPWEPVPKSQRAKKTAAGAYQILIGSYSELIPDLWLTQNESKFTPAIQDRLAVALVERRFALGLIRRGKIREVMSETSINQEWITLPGGSGNKERHNIDNFINMFNKYLKEESKKVGLS